MEPINATVAVKALMNFKLSWVRKTREWSKYSFQPGEVSSLWPMNKANTI